MIHTRILASSLKTIQTNFVIGHIVSYLSKKKGKVVHKHLVKYLGIVIFFKPNWFHEGEIYNHNNHMQLLNKELEEC